MEREKIIQSWHERADPYEKLLQKYPIFTDMVITLIHFLREHRIDPTNVIDLAAGTGLVSKLFMHYLHLPPSSLILIEPAAEMCSIARKNLPHCQIEQIAAEDLLSLSHLPRHSFDLIVSNASMHLMSDEIIYPIVDQLLKRDRGYFLYTLWYHAFDETENYHNDDEFHQCVNQALIFHQYPIYYIATDADNARRSIRTRESLRNTAEHFHLHFHSATIYKDEIPMEFELDFALMSSNWLMEHLRKHRPNEQDPSSIKMKIVEKIREMINGKKSKIAFVRIVVSRENFEQ